MILKYLRQVLRHKYFVFIEACKLNVPWLGLIHDASKFQLRELLPYARYFYGNYPSLADYPSICRRCPSYTGRTLECVKREFDVAWNEHQKKNRHHWQAWLYVRLPCLTTTDKIEVCSHIIERETIDDQRPANARRWTFSIGRTKILVNDSDGARCLRCGKTFPLDIFGALPMPERYIREMIADWRGACRAYGNGNILDWYYQNKNKRIMHSDTRRRVEHLLHITDETKDK